MKKILLIEDNTDMRENTAEILELANYEVITAKNGKEGVEAAQRHLPDLIICDIMMPELDGYGVLHLLSKNSKTAGIPFIFLTAKAERSDMRRGMELGADDYLTKPFDDIELLNAVETRLRKNDLLKKEFTRDIAGLTDFIRSAHGFEDLKKLAEEQEVKSFAKKEVIYKEGSYAKGIYFLNKGKVKIYKTHEEGREFILALVKAGEFFGYHALLENGRYAESAAALEESEVMFIPGNQFYALVFNNAEVSKKFIKMLCNNVAELEDQLVRLAYNSVRKRVAEALVKLHDRYKEQNQPFSMRVLREDLASIVGTAKESLIRTLSDFKSEGLIDIEDKAIIIRNYDKLLRMRN
ncbi:MAG: transcriptional regulator [Chitinophagales bacterium]|nr:MAG: transcriptional regulator [Chitinophagales bacterium]